MRNVVLFLFYASTVCMEMRLVISAAVVSLV